MGRTTIGSTVLDIDINTEALEAGLARARVLLEEFQKEVASVFGPNPSYPYSADIRFEDGSFVNVRSNDREGLMRLKKLAEKER